MLTEARIKAELIARGISPPKIIFYDVTDSTNTRAKEYARENPLNREAVIFIANEQTGGRGRRGRSFVSRSGAGIYISILTYPDESATNATGQTARAAVLLSRAIEAVCDCKIGIKWVNDLYLGGKKLAGILTEGEVDESGKIAYQIIGMGINVYKSAISDEISDIATSLEHQLNSAPDRSKLSAMIIKEMLSSRIDCYPEYCERSIIIGKDVRVLKLSEEYSAKVKAINPDFSLSIELGNGEIERLFTGEISLKL